MRRGELVPVLVLEGDSWGSNKDTEALRDCMKERGASGEVVGWVEAIGDDGSRPGRHVERGVKGGDREKTRCWQSHRVLRHHLMLILYLYLVLMKSADDGSVGAQGWQQESRDVLAA